MECRLPSTRNIFKGLGYVNPDKVLSQTVCLPFYELPFAHLKAENEYAIEEQYRKVQFMNWADEKIFDGKIPRDTVEFWSDVLEYQTSTENKPFKHIAQYVLSCLCLPISNAVTESISSLVTCVKTKQRNRMQLKALDSIVRIRSNLNFGGHCCRDVIVTDKMLELFNSKQMYVTSEFEGEEIDKAFDILYSV